MVVTRIRPVPDVSGEFRPQRDSSEIILLLISKSERLIDGSAQVPIHYIWRLVQLQLHRHDLQCFISGRCLAPNRKSQKVRKASKSRRIRTAHWLPSHESR